MTKTPATVCKAKDPTTCRVHGQFTVQFKTWLNDQKVEPAIAFKQITVPFQPAELQPTDVKDSGDKYTVVFSANSNGHHWEHGLSRSYEIEGSNIKELRRNVDREVSYTHDALSEESLSFLQKQGLEEKLAHLSTLRGYLKRPDSLKKLKSRGNAFSRVDKYTNDSDELSLPWQKVDSGMSQKVYNYGRSINKRFNKLSDPEKAVILAQSLIKHEPALREEPYRWGHPKFNDYAEDVWKIYKKADKELSRLGKTN